MQRSQQYLKSSRQGSLEHDQLVTQNLPLVKYVMGKLSKNLPPHVDRDDLLAAGSLGLAEAARRYDPSRKVPFHSYAIPRIWGAMLDELRSHDWLSADGREQVKRMEKTVETLRGQGNDSPTEEDISAAMGCSVTRLNRIRMLANCENRSQGEEDLSSEYGEGGLYARLGVAGPRGPLEAAEFEDQKCLLAQAIGALPERERQVILMRYNEELLLNEIGQILGVSESRICQMHVQALRRLKSALAGVGMAAL